MHTYQYAHRRVAVCAVRAVPSSRSVQVRRSMYEASDRSMRYQSLVVPSYRRSSRLSQVVTRAPSLFLARPARLLPRIACALVPQHFVFLSTSSSCARACFRATCPPAVKCASPQWVQQRLRWYSYVAPSSIQWAAGQHGTMFSSFRDMFACICGPLPACSILRHSCGWLLLQQTPNRPPSLPSRPDTTHIPNALQFYPCCTGACSAESG
jgi:hypothetical protein